MSDMPINAEILDLARQMLARREDMPTAHKLATALFAAIEKIGECKRARQRDLEYAVGLTDLLQRIALGLRTHGFSVTAEEIDAALAKNPSAVVPPEAGLLPKAALMPTEEEMLRVERDNLRLALRFYANGYHADLPDWEAPDEPNWLCPPSDIEGEEPRTKPWTPNEPQPKRLKVHADLPWIVEDGGIARCALLGKIIDWEGDEPAPIEGEPDYVAPEHAPSAEGQTEEDVPTPAMREAAATHARIRANMIAAEAWPEGTTRDEKRLRGLLARRVGITYGDDGELQSGEPAPAIDFKRDSVDDIERKLIERGITTLTRAPRATDDMVNRFLSWKLPPDFAPDCHISFRLPDPVLNPNPTWPVGTNLFTSDQARAMLAYVLGEEPRATATDIADDPQGFAEALRSRPDGPK